MRVIDLLNKTKKLSDRKIEYYNAENFIALVYEQSAIEAEDMVLLPFYKTDSITYELYDYEFSITVTNDPDMEKYILKRTGCSSVEEINSKIFTKLTKCHAELEFGQDEATASAIISYLNYILENHDLKADVISACGHFDSANLYFEYF